MKIISLLVMATMLAIGSSLLAQEASEVPAPCEITIGLDFHSFFWTSKSIQLKKGQELVVNVKNPNNVWHHEANRNLIDPRAILCTLSWWCECLEIENNLNTNGDPMTYHVKAKNISGVGYIYFGYLYQTGDDIGLYDTTQYVDPCIEVTVE